VTQSSLSRKNDNQFAVSGILGFDSVTTLMEQSKSLFADANNIDIDLSDVSHADSAGLALLLEWLRYGKQNSKAVRYQNLPAQLRSLAAISEVDTLLLHQA
jgi:phospholipid transport system transporter-binding protein